MKGMNFEWSIVVLVLLAAVVGIDFEGRILKAEVAVDVEAADTWKAQVVGIEIEAVVVVVVVAWWIAVAVQKAAAAVGRASSLDSVAFVAVVVAWKVAAVAEVKLASWGQEEQEAKEQLDLKYSWLCQ